MGNQTAFSCYSLKKSHSVTPQDNLCQISPWVIKGVSGCTIVYEGVYGGVYKRVQGCTSVYKRLQACTSVYKCVQACTSVYNMTVKDMYSTQLNKSINK